MKIAQFWQTLNIHTNIHFWSKVLTRIANNVCYCLIYHFTVEFLYKALYLPFYSFWFYALQTKLYFWKDCELKFVCMFMFQMHDPCSRVKELFMKRITFSARFNGMKIMFAMPNLKVLSFWVRINVLKHFHNDLNWMPSHHHFFHFLILAELMRAMSLYSGDKMSNKTMHTNSNSKPNFGITLKEHLFQFILSVLSKSVSRDDFFSWFLYSVFSIWVYTDFCELIQMIR